MTRLRMTVPEKIAWGAAMVAAPLAAVMLSALAIGGLDRQDGALASLMFGFDVAAALLGFAGAAGFLLYLSKRLPLSADQRKHWRAAVWLSGGLAMPLAYFRLILPLPR